ncbi:protein of unknown function [Candidatus Promineifilum breve]|uniref:Right handed beta helix domain-containing protein n=1 Tax=Candidatus Promineifilum breve TaxID=1806508 RepID=A0A170PHD8_9CHLR|nr:hypothetical protein [Candidatus Promineifilum breve]CUS04253.2 protein of unknown function [Candidatus Promineifilum breve]
MKEYYVDGQSGDDGAAGTSGAPWATLGRALAAAEAGDVIRARTAVYRESIGLVRAGVTLRADEGQEPVIDGGYGPELFGKAGYTTRTGGALKADELPYPHAKNQAKGGWVIAQDQAAILRVLADDTVVDGFFVRNVCGRAFRVAAKRAKLLNCRFDFTYSGTGIFDDTCEDCLMDGCKVTRGSMKFFDPTVDNSKGTQTNVMVRGKRTVVRNSKGGICCGEFVSIDKRAVDGRVEGCEIVGCLHASGYANETEGAAFVDNVFLWPRELLGVFKGKVTPSDGLIFGNEQEDTVTMPRVVVRGNIFVGHKRPIVVANGSSGRPVAFRDGEFAHNTVVGDEETLFLLGWGTPLGSRHEQTAVVDNVFLRHPDGGGEAAILWQGNGGAQFGHNLSNVTLPTAMRSEGDVVAVDGQNVLVAPFAEVKMVTPVDIKGMEPPDLRTTFDRDNYRPIAGSAAIGAASDGGTVGALEPAVVEPPPPPPPPPPDGVDLDALANLAAEAWGLLGHSGQRMTYALDVLNEAMERQAAAREQLQRLVDLINEVQV